MKRLNKLLELTFLRKTTVKCYPHVWNVMSFDELIDSQPLDVVAEVFTGEVIDFSNFYETIQGKLGSVFSDPEDTATRAILCYGEVVITILKKFAVTTDGEPEDALYDCLYRLVSDRAFSFALWTILVKAAEYGRY